MIQVYGIPNCNTVKKARDWLTENDIAYTFNDFKKAPPTEALLSTWLIQHPWEKLVNRAGMTWRKLSDDEKAAVHDNGTAIGLMLAKPSIIKRPVLVKPDGTVLLGFSEKVYQESLI